MTIRYSNVTPLWPTAETRGSLYQPLTSDPDYIRIPADVESPACWDLDESDSHPLNIQERRVLVLGIIIGIWPGAFITLGVELLMRVM